MAIAGFIFGTMVFTHQYHRALSMGEQPAEMTWETLTEKGLDDNSFVRLTDVRILGVQTEDELFDELMADLDPNLSPEELEAKVAQAMQPGSPEELFDSTFKPAVVISKDADPDTAPELVLIPRINGFASTALSQLENEGAITGYISSYGGDEFAKTMMTLLGQDTRELDIEMQDKAKVYTLEPMAEPLDQSEASSRFWMAGLGLALGLILCGSGGPSIICCVFFWGPSFLSLIGYPMRYGRGSTFTRLIYAGAGIMLLGYGYKLMFMDGHFGKANGDPVLHALGFICSFIGLAAVMSVPMQILVRKFVASTEVKPRRPEKRMSYEAACSMKPIETEPARDTRYRDGSLVPSTGGSLPDEMQQTVDSLGPLGFAAPLNDQWQRGESPIHTAIQLGCQNMVVCDIEWTEDEQMQTRLVSVLHDGMTVITISKNMKVAASTRLGSNGFYVVCDTIDPLEMMSEHLEQTATMAEKRDTTVVKIDDEELKDVCLLGRRVLADIRAQYGEEIIDVDAKSYGRFCFPAQRIVGELASV